MGKNIRVDSRVYHHIRHQQTVLQLRENEKPLGMRRRITMNDALRHLLYSRES
jgi:hypothetical protein